MTALELERLLAEEWPDGSFGGPRPATRRYIPRTSPVSAARHRADLETAINRTRRPRKAT
ncbi:hypothetical protein ACIQV3_22475 [Streptomyces sp. NPDC099050]|uniref:hypothetical protein n=1 Tax=Streptomyces sp. NPDC099050 TaxID=3366100 RepID=UPI00382C44B8